MKRKGTGKGKGKMNRKRQRKRRKKRKKSAKVPITITIITTMISPIDLVLQAPSAKVGLRTWMQVLQLHWIHVYWIK